METFPLDQSSANAPIKHEIRPNWKNPNLENSYSDPKHIIFPIDGRSITSVEVRNSRILESGGINLY